MKKHNLTDGSTALNAYHQERSKAAFEEVKEMQKHPFTFEEAKSQTVRIYEGMARSGRKRKEMKISDYKILISVLPFMEQAFEIKRGNWEDLISEEYLEKIFNLNDIINPNVKQKKDHRILISRFELFHDQPIEILLIKILMWGYPTRGRGRNIENVLKEPNFSEIKILLTNLKDKGDITIGDIKEVLKIGGLGLSTLTKFLYFMRLTVESYRALILDQRVISAINSNIFCDKGIEKFKKLRYENAVDNYIEYLSFSHEIADQLHLKPDQVEMFLFEYGQNLKGMVPMN
ncbi:MAG: hypothetical protein WCL21_02165 [Mariniphaga sp.]